LENRLVLSGTPSLNAVAAINTSDIWAVGLTAAVFSGGNLVTPELPFTEHWNGTKWTTISTPALTSGNFGFFDSVAAVSSNNVWAVGETGNISPFSTLIEHWDGSKWSIVTSPTLTNSAILDAVTAISATDIWAVGNQAGINLIEHYNGTSWSIVTSPTGTHQGILGVSGSSSSDVWAVGMAGRYAGVQTLHWNGTAWSSVTAPSPTNQSDLLAVSARTTSDAWGVGLNNDGTTLIEHWNGTAWSVVTSPSLGSGNGGQLNGVVALASNNAWAVGTESTSAGSSPLIEHWDGTKWSIFSSPSETGQSMSGVTAVDANDIWAAGGTGLIEKFNGTSWSVVAKPTTSSGGGGGSAVGGGTTNSVLHAGSGSGSSLAGQPGGMTASVVTSPSTTGSGSTLSLAGAHGTLIDADGDTDGLGL
jgi:hypothetical protein